MLWVYSALGHCWDSQRLGAVAIAVFGHCRDTLWSFQGCCAVWALYGYFAVGHCKDVLRLGTEGFSAAGHCWDILPLGTAEIF